VQIDVEGAEYPFLEAYTVSGAETPATQMQVKMSIFIYQNVSFYCDIFSACKHNMAVTDPMRWVKEGFLSYVDKQICFDTGFALHFQGTSVKGYVALLEMGQTSNLVTHIMK